MSEAGLSAHEIAVASSLSDSTLSRYISGDRCPSPESGEFESLYDGLKSLLTEKGIDVSELSEEMLSSVPDLYTDTREYSSRLSSLMKCLSVSNAYLAKRTGYDPSFISRILSGERFPADHLTFSDQAAECFVSCADDPKGCKKIDGLFGSLSFSGADKEVKVRMISSYLLTGDASAGEQKAGSQKKASIIHYLEKLDAFDLNDYMKKIHFDKLIVPSLPVSSTTKQYMGIKGYKSAELGFLKRTVLSGSSEQVFMFSDMPMEEVASDISFSKKWMLWLAMLLKKGIGITIVHNINRPVDEMILGLEAWIPLYMTGLISPYYKSGKSDDGIHHMLRISENCSLMGECIGDDTESSLFTVGGSRELRNQAEKRKEFIMADALPLMEIYTEDRKKEFDEMLKKEKAEAGSTDGEYPKNLKFASDNYFKNIKISSVSPKLTVITKENAPMMHFAIRNPRVIDAIESLDKE